MNTAMVLARPVCAITTRSTAVVGIVKLPDIIRIGKDMIDTVLAVVIEMERADRVLDVCPAIFCVGMEES
jgi:hypothetical protein